MPLDANSQTWVYDGTESASPFKTMLNLLANSVRDSINSVKASFSDTAQGAANWAYNSCFDIWQRGTSFTAVGWTADRWYLAARTATTMQRVTPAATDTFFQTKYAAQLLATAATNSATLTQPYANEDVAEMRGKQVIFVVPMQGLNAASAATIAVQKNTVADSSTAAGWVTINSATFTPGTAGTIATVTATIPADSTAAGVRLSISTNNNPNGFGVNIGKITYKAGTTTPAQHQRRGRTIKGEERECQNWFQKLLPTGSGYYGFTISRAESSNANIFSAVLNLAAPMRISPTIDSSQSNWGALGTYVPGIGGYNLTALPTIYPLGTNFDRVLISGTTSAAIVSAGNTAWFGAVNGNGTLAFTAELS